MNAIPAEAQGEPGHDQQQEQGQEPGHLAVVGGRGRPSKEAVEAKRTETRETLERWGLFEAAKNRRSKAFNSWGLADCDAALAWGQKQVANNGHVEEFPGEPDDPAGYDQALSNLCDCCGVAPAEAFGADYKRCPDCMAGISMEASEIVRGEGPWVDERILFGIIHAEHEMWGLDTDFANGWDSLQMVRAWDGFRGITGAFRLLHAALRAEGVRYDAYRTSMEALVKSLERELAESFGDLQRMTRNPDYKASLMDIALVAGIDRGRFVRDLRKKLQQVITDAVGRDDAAYKGKVKAVLTITFDKSEGRPSEALAAIITCEVNEDTPPAVSGSKIYFATDGELVPNKDALEQMPLFRGSSQAQAAQ